MAYDATNPNMSAATIANRRYDALDVLLELRDYGASAISASTAGTAVSLKAEKQAYYKAIINHAAIGGTVDGTNYWTINVEVAADQAFTNAVIVGTVQLTADASQYHIALDGVMVEKIRAAAGEDEAIYVRANAVETGTTAGSLTYGAYLTC